VKINDFNVRIRDGFQNFSLNPFACNHTHASCCGVWRWL
jgi:hypothetical protein